MIHISATEAKNFYVRYHNLDQSGNFTAKDGVMQYFERVGSIQYDPLNVVGRNAELVLQSKVKDYKMGMLDKLLYQDRVLVDGWDKMMGIYARKDWADYEFIRKSKDEEIKYVLQKRNSLQALEYVELIKNKIQDKGPLKPSDIELGSAQPGRWGHKKLSSASMDYMFQTGILGIYDKINVQKVYDLSENLYPEEVKKRDENSIAREDFLCWYVKRRIGSIGLLWNKNGGGWLGQYISEKKIREPILNKLLEEEEIEEVKVGELKDIFYIRKKDEKYLKDSKRKKVTSFLAPLDNLIWDRTLIEKVFHFTYSWEVYTPISKRKYGYYVMPVLYGNRFIARFEPDTYRKPGKLSIKNWWWEPDVKVNDAMLESIKKAFYKFALYLDIENFKYKEIEDSIMCGNRS